MSARRWGVALLAAGLATLAGRADAQAQLDAQTGAELERMIDRADSETVSFRYDSNDDAKYCNFRKGRWRDNADCWTGPAEVTLDLRRGEVTDLDVEIVREESSPPRRATSLGTVSPEAATEYLLGLVETTRASVAEDAIGAAAMADDVVIWPELLDFARDRGLGSKVRQAATFWVGQASADEAVSGLRDIVDDDPDSQVRQSAVFALSQHEGIEVVPTLIEIAEEANDPEVRRSAFFWLAQHEDDRVLDYFERVLRGRG